MRIITKIIIILLAGIFTVGCCGSRTAGSVYYKKATNIYKNAYIGFSSEDLFDIKDLVESDKYLKEAPLPRKYKKLLVTNKLGKGEILYTALLFDFNIYIVAVRTKFQGDRPAKLPILPMLVDKSALPCVDNFDIKWYESHDGEKVLFYHHSVLKNGKTAFNVFSHHKEWGINSVMSIYFIENYKDVKTAGDYSIFPENQWLFNRTTSIYSDEVFEDILQP